MGGEFKKCPYCAEEIRAEAVVCRFCHRELQQGPPQAAPPPTDAIVQQGVAKDVERRTIQSEVRRRRALARLFGAGSVVSGIICLFLAYDAASSHRTRSANGIVFWAAACVVLFITYMIVRPKYTGAECPHCHGFAVKRGNRSGCISASYFLKCDDCMAEFGGTGGGCACLGMIALLGTLVSGIAALILISLR